MQREMRSVPHGALWNVRNQAANGLCYLGARFVASRCELGMKSVLLQGVLLADYLPVCPGLEIVETTALQLGSHIGWQAVLVFILDYYHIVTRRVIKDAAKCKSTNINRIQYLRFNASSITWNNSMIKLSRFCITDMRLCAVINWLFIQNSFS